MLFMLISVARKSVLMGYQQEYCGLINKIKDIKLNI